MRALMVQGVSSDAGKSFVATALCRWLARRGVRVVPFKAQNMSNNARVVDGGEIGTAQWLQARAAGITPDVRMNPVLLKPEAGTRSQVVVGGRVDHRLSKSPWRGRSAALWPYVTAAFESLAAGADVVVIEGAGSPAETNLWANDVVNMRVADLAGASVVVVADIDRGGAFAHLYGTWALLPRPWRDRVEGFVLNKFRGDPALLAPAPGDLEARTGVPTVGVVPFVRHGLPDEEGPTVFAGAHGRRIALLCGPFASNLDEFVPLQQVAAVALVDRDRALTSFDLVILPGSKHVAADLEWLRRSGLAGRVTNAARRGVPVLGICGGLQMLGGAIRDVAGVEGSGHGLGLLDVETTVDPEKRTARTSVSFGDLPDAWSWLSGRTVAGYEIRHGRSTPASERVAPATTPDGLGFAAGNVLGVYVHGLFEDADVLDALTGARAPSLETVFDALADLVDRHLDTRWLAARVGL